MFTEYLEKWTKMTGIIKLFFTGIMILLLFVIIGLTFSSALDRPGTCGLCHNMEPFVSSFLEPLNGSVIQKHELGCIDCHTNSSASRARASRNFHMLNEITGFKLDLPRKDMAVNCSRCHVIDDYFHLNSSKTFSCTDCHWAHDPKTSLYSPKNDTVAVLIPYGPHRNQTCGNCHGPDFKIPRCTDCHGGHYEKNFDNEVCLGCHFDPHIPEIPGKFPKYMKGFKGNLSFETCMPCHEKEYFDVAYSFSRHTEMQTCTLCHTVHGKIPGCESCHKVMDKQQHPEFYCKNCHKTLESGNIVSCFDCHGRNVHDLVVSDAFWNPK